MSSSRPLTTASRLFPCPSAASSTTTASHILIPSPPVHIPKTPSIGVAEQNGAPRKVCDKTMVNDSFCVVRWDLPGIASEDLKIWVNEKKELVLEGKIKGKPKYEYRRGDYSGAMPGISELFHVDLFTAELKHGALWIILPLTEMAKKAMKWEREVLGKRKSSDFNV
ncbi:uncharacterized protein LOC132306294 [Cornus florida]|uniref:uncharacterized protein LOC132306294 n=1 Tax=Cornus florida TaxID=4283 RepID=UPI0028A1A13A|nr:uncharacterized protein LOC132306294 [Cornus florida]